MNVNWRIDYKNVVQTDAHTQPPLLCCVPAYNDIVQV